MFDLLPNPLHPAVVHMPIALIVLLPFFVAGSWYAIRRGARPLVAWGITTALLATLSLSAFVALQTGNTQGEKVEEVIGEKVIETHEEMAETFLILSCVVLGVAGFGFIKGTPGSLARAATGVGVMALLGFGARVGHTGGQLVYQHNAASALGLADSTAAVKGGEGGEEDEKGRGRGGR